MGDDLRPPLRHQSLCRPKHADKRVVTSAIEYASIVLSSIYIECACVDAGVQSESSQVLEHLSRIVASEDPAPDMENSNPAG